MSFAIFQPAKALQKKSFLLNLLNPARMESIGVLFFNRRASSLLNIECFDQLIHAAVATQ